jgi:hypothetical protein
MRPASRAKLFKLKPVGMLALVFLGDVVSLLALSASQSDLFLHDVSPIR